MDVQYALVERIREAVPALRAAGGAVELDALLSGQIYPTPPAAYVVLTAQRPAADEGFTGATVQRVTSHYLVVFVTQNFADATGSAIAPELQRLRAQVRKALLGWPPDPQTGEPVQAGDCELIDVINGHTFWGDAYQINHYWSDL